MNRILITVIVFVCCVFSARCQVISTIAGNGILGNSGDGGPATAAELFPGAILFDTSGNYYVSDSYNNVIRRVSPTGIISTFAGTGAPTSTGDGGLALAASFNHPEGMAFDQSGNLYVVEWEGQRVRRISPSGIVSTVVGTGVAGYSGDGGAATNARISSPTSVCFDRNGNLLVADGGCQGIRKISPDGIISTIAGIGGAGYGGDGGPATAAVFHGVEGIAVDLSGNIYVADNENYRIRKIATSGIVTTIAGTGYYGSSGNGGLATAASICVFGLAVDEFNNIFFSDNCFGLVRKVSHDGTINIVAGDGIQGYSGDGGPATAAELFLPYSISLDSCGNIYVPDGGSYRLRVVTYSQCNYLTTKELQISKISIYPNPAINELNIDHVAAGCSYRLISLLGVVVQQGALKSGENAISIAHFASGLYLLEITDADGVKEIRKIMKD